MRRLLIALLPMMAVVALLVAALWLAADTESAQSHLGKGYSGLLIVAVSASLLLIATVLRESWRLLSQWRSAEPGSRLNARLTMLIAAVAIPPIVLVSVFAMRFVDTGVDSWFRADVAASQRDAEAVGREVLASFERRARSAGSRYSNLLAQRGNEDLQALLDSLLSKGDDPAHLSLYDESGNLLAITFNTSEVVFPAPPSDEERLQVRAAGQLADSARVESTLVLRVLDPVSGIGILQSIFPVAADIAPKLDALERTAIDYAQLSFQRQAMKSTFMLILGLVSLIALLGALSAAFAATRRLVKPISDLSVAVNKVAEGHYGESLSIPSSDELGFLTRDFNRMSFELAAANARESASRAEIEQNRAQLGAILERLSAGVVSFDRRAIRTANPAAGALLDLDSNDLIGLSIEQASAAYPRAAPLLKLFGICADTKRDHWREEIQLSGEPSRALLVRGALLVGNEEPSFVSVFDDAAVIALSQREAAWAEVAKRLAHEIKNPLTPIQLAAERLRHKFLGKLAPTESEVLDRATQSIVSQVEALKRIVNAFGDYTRPSDGEKQWFDPCRLIDEVVGLYEHSGQSRVRRLGDRCNVLIFGNRERLRQALINLFTNAIEANAEPAPAPLDLHMKLQSDVLEITLRDYGPGLPSEFDGRWFEPYNSTKPKGSGLGLAWVKKIVEEFGGTVTAKNAPQGGAQFSVAIPAKTPDAE